jgi:hypothetical protein
VIAIRRPISRQQWNPEPLVLDHAPPAEAVRPPHRLEDEVRQHVEEVVVRYLEAAVDLVHPPQRLPAGGAVVAVLDDRRDDQVGVVVALLRAGRELPRRVEPLPDRRHRVRAEERELERASRVERELVADDEVRDPLVVGDRVEAEDLLEVRRRPHRRIPVCPSE